MRLPQLNAIAKSVDYRIEFKGLNHNLYVGEGEFWDTLNLAATNYPVMTPRAARGLVTTITEPQGLYARGKLCWAADQKLYYNGTQVAGVTLTTGQKQFVGMGAYIIVFPDGKRYNTSNGQVDSLAASWAQTATATITLSRMDGTPYQDVTPGDSAPTDAEEGDYWLDTSETPHTLKILSYGSWQTITTTYAKIESTNVGADFKAGDAVEISGGPDAVNGSHEIVARGADYIVIPCVLDTSATVASGMAVARSVPAMDYVCELNNRLWGCSSTKHEIYCCKLGDPTNWNSLGTGAADAWAATVGSDGDFTGCCSFGGSVLFFKEDMLHKLFGNKPSNFQINDQPLRGVQKGSEKSLCVVGESLLYKARDGVMIYDSGQPMLISQGLGTGLYQKATAGAMGDKYYISMQDEDNAWSLFVFNVEKGMWHREDATHATYFAALNGQLYFLTEAGKLTAVYGRRETGATVEEPFDWYAETGDMLIDQPDNKYISRIQVRASVAQEATLKIEAMYDSSGDWITIYRRGKSRKASFTVPIIPARCDHLRLRISGHGQSAVYAISKETERGSEL